MLLEENLFLTNRKIDSNCYTNKKNTRDKSGLNFKEKFWTNLQFSFNITDKDLASGDDKIVVLKTFADVVTQEAAYNKWWYGQQPN